MPTLSILLSLSCAPICQESVHPKPRLGVVVAIEHLSPEHFERLGPRLQGGLGRFREAGRLMLAGELDYAGTDNAPGYATLATGVEPRGHGIVANAFRLTPDAEVQPATRDSEVETLAGWSLISGKESGGSSPRKLTARTLGDRLVEAAPGARVISIGGSARGAVLLGGAQADWSLWWDRRAGGFTSSTYYGEELPVWVREWNEGWGARASGWTFEARLGDLIEAGFGPDAREGEIPSSAAGAVLPFSLPTLGDAPAPLEYQRLSSALAVTPLADHFAIELALRAVEQLELGADETPDLLALSPTAFGVTVRRTGPFSVESAEALVALDAELGRLFDALDERLGADAWVAVLGSSSGCLGLPSALRARGVGAESISSVHTRRALSEVRSTLDERFGAFFAAAIHGRVLDLDDAAIAAAGVDAREVRALARDALLEAAPFVAAAYTRDQITESAAPGEPPWIELYRRSFQSQRAPDVALRFQPWTIFGQRSGSNSGSPYPYDRRIVIGMLGAAVEPGVSYAPARLEELAPIWLELVGVEP